jgi:bifunctional UDP-N-acetylglucosamine pyrophosphorylase/glucosamine-1-phosphate N-acetyltransferase
MEHLVIASRDAGISDFVLVVGYGEGAVRDHFGDGSRMGVSITYRTQRWQHGTADALASVGDSLTGPFLLLNGDMVIESGDIAAMAAMEPPVMGIWEVTNATSYGTVTLEGSRVSTLEEKSPSPRSRLINAGIYTLDPGALDLATSVRDSPRGEREFTDALATYITDGALRAHRLRSWFDMGRPWDLLNVNEAFMRGITHEIEGRVEEGVVIQGNVRVGAGTVVRAGTIIEGPCIIGKDCRIGPHAYIRGATAIGDRCHIGHATEVKNSVVMEGTNLPHFNYVGDSVIGRDCNLGAGTKVANLRHDRAVIRACGEETGRVKFGAVIGDGSLFGINCSLNPGTVVGAGTTVAAHTLVTGCLEGAVRLW